LNLYKDAVLGNRRKDAFVRAGWGGYEIIIKNIKLNVMCGLKKLLSLLNNLRKYLLW